MTVSVNYGSMNCRFDELLFGELSFDKTSMYGLYGAYNFYGLLRLISKFICQFQCAEYLSCFAFELVT